MFGHSCLFALTVVALVLHGDAAPAAVSSTGAAQTVGAYKIVPMGWIGQIFPNGPNVTLSGSFDEIVAQILVLNPLFKFETSTAEELERRDMEFLEKLNMVEKRQDGYPSYTLCNRDQFLNAQVGYIRSGEQYLSGVPGLCTLSPGAGQCGRVSCSYNSAIFFCNDADHGQYINCAEIGTYSRLARYDCNVGDNTQNSISFNSQRFRIDTEYSVLDAYSAC